MNLFFFQNCISPHQIPFIEELSVFTDVDRVVVIAPRVDYDDRKLMGWKTSKLLETKRYRVFDYSYYESSAKTI